VRDRYGNVMASRGSVIPLFIEQLKVGKALTITDGFMTRFLMSLEESVDLVLHAFEYGEQGDIFVQKSPAATIEVLAQAIKELFHSPIPIKVIGTRHGESFMNRSCPERRWQRRRTLAASSGFLPTTEISITTTSSSTVRHPSRARTITHPTTPAIERRTGEVAVADAGLHSGGAPCLRC